MRMLVALGAVVVGSRSPEMRPRQRTAVTFSFRMNIAATFATLPGCIAVIPTGPEPLSRAAELETWEQSRRRTNSFISGACVGSANRSRNMRTRRDAGPLPPH